VSPGFSATPSERAAYDDERAGLFLYAPGLRFGSPFVSPVRKAQAELALSPGCFTNSCDPIVEITLSIALP
jgi:hypothetical protein